jgi:hypothetical protein
MSKEFLLLPEEGDTVVSGFIMAIQGLSVERQGEIAHLVLANALLQFPADERPGCLKRFFERAENTVTTTTAQIALMAVPPGGSA